MSSGFCDINAVRHPRESPNLSVIIRNSNIKQLSAIQEFEEVAAMATQMAEAEFGAPRFGQNLRVGLPCSMFLSVFWGEKRGVHSWQEKGPFPWHCFFEV